MNIVQSWKVTLLRVTGRAPRGSEREAKKSWKNFFWKAVCPALPLIVVIMLAVAWMDHVGWLRGFETSHLDTMIRLRQRDMSKNVVVVEISEDDYQGMFEGTSPLNKFKLLELIQAVQKYNPTVIGVDIDTNDWGMDCKRAKVEPSRAAKCEDLRAKLQALRTAGKPPAGSTAQPTAIVWATVPRSQDPPLLLNPAPGSLLLPSDYQGIPRFPVDDDGSVRHFDSRVEVAQVDGVCPDGTHEEHCYDPTFAAAVLKEYPANRPASGERVIFNFYGDRNRFPILDARQLFSVKFDDDKRTQKQIDAETAEIELRRRELLEGRIVLIGGGFLEARDQYFTPLGLMQGVELNALAIQTDLSGGGVRDVTRVWEVLIDLCVSIFVVGMFYLCQTRPWKALGMSTLVIPVSFVSSLALFNTVAYWFNFIPVAAGVVVHQLLELAETGAKAQEKLEELGRERARVEVVVASVEEVAAVEAGPVDKASGAEDSKVKRAAGGAH
jgi:CHASE2 domain-containing sensor protein